MLDLIYCAGGNPRLDKIALDTGFLLGIRSDRNADGYPVSFIDIDYKRPDFERHLRTVQKYQPKYATVTDLSDRVVSEDDIVRAITQVERLASYCGTVFIIPKLPGQLTLIPPGYAIGYSVPTHYGGASYPLWELTERRIHLLGGSPHLQMQCYLHLGCVATITSADGNMAQKMAVPFAKYWQAGRWVKHPEYRRGTPDLYLDCWRRSCQNIYEHWRGAS